MKIGITCYPTYGGSRAVATELGLQLAAYGCPALDLPPALGGHGLDHPPRHTDPDPLPLRRVEGVPAMLTSVMRRK